MYHNESAKVSDDWPKTGKDVSTNKRAIAMDEALQKISELKQNIKVAAI